MSIARSGYLRDVQYRFPDRLKARSVLHTRYGRGDWFEWLAANIPLSSGSTVADVGCGGGAFWTNAPLHVPNDLILHLVDISSGMVEAVKTALDLLNRWQNVEAVVGDAAALPLRNASIDTLIAVHMLYHLENPALGLKEMGRVTREGGTVAVVLNPAGTMSELSALARTALNPSSKAHPAPLSSEQGLALMRTQFKHVDVVRYDDELRVTDPVDLLGYLGSLPIADEAGAMEKLGAAVDEAFRRSDGVFKITKASDLLLGHR